MLMLNVSALWQAMVALFLNIVNQILVIYVL